VAELVCHRLCAGWGETQVLSDVSFRLGANRTLAILGRNGVGKSTLLSTVVGRATRKAGSIALDGRTIDALPSFARARAGIGFVPQEREIFPSLTVLENLTVGARPGFWTLSRVYDFFPRLAERARNRGDQLSGGEQQMLSIARALMGQPSVLLMDEPLEGLAPVIVDLLVATIQRLRRETELALLLVEQHVDIALELADNAIVLDRGAIVYDSVKTGGVPDRATIENLIGVGG
jgi:branched-chain amino acid transport system ATP-binding protein